MDEFQKKLLWMCKRELKLVTVILIGLVLALAIYGSALYFTEYEPFGGIEDGYAKMDVSYVLGPFAGETEDDRVTCEYYFAKDQEGYWYVLGLAPDHELPVYGIDLKEEKDLEALVPQTVYGYSTGIPYDLVPYMLEYFENTDLEITEDNYPDYFGFAYLDATDTDSEAEGLIFLVLAAVLLIGTVALQFTGNRKKKMVKQQIEEMLLSGEFKKLYEDFRDDRGAFYRSLKIAVSPNYVLDYVCPGGIDIIPLDNVVNAFKCNMSASGCPLSESFIALETEDGKRIQIANSEKADTEFQNALQQIKKIICEGRGEEA